VVEQIETVPMSADEYEPAGRRVGHLDRQMGEEVPWAPQRDTLSFRRGLTVPVSPAAGFLAHLVSDVGTGLAGLVLVERCQDAVHQLADRGLVDGLGGRGQGDARLRRSAMTIASS
jgi:hypothetical protein